MNIEKHLLYSFLFFCTAYSPAFAQFPTTPQQGQFGEQTPGLQDSIAKPLEQEGINRLVQPDTIVLEYFHADDLSEIYAKFDTTLNDVWKFSPARRQLLPHAVTGILGGASFPMFYEAVERRGADVGFHQFDLYYKNATDLKFSERESGHTKARYAAVGGEQQDGFLEIEWGRKFNDGYHFSAEANRIFQTGETKHFRNQGTKQYNFLIGAGYNEKDSPYKAFLMYASNSTELKDNGGIVSENAGADTPFSEQVYSLTGSTRHSRQSFALVHYLGFFGKLDSSGQRRNYTLAHRLNYDWATYKFTDTDPTLNGDDTLNYYAAFPVDRRGLRFFMQHQKLQNRITLQTFKNNRKEGRNDLLEVGIDHQYHNFHYAPDSLTRNNLFLLGNWKIRPSKSLKFNALGHFGILDNAGDYRVEGNVEFQYGNWGKLTGSFVNQLYEPSIVQERFNLNLDNIWQENFEKTLSTSVKGNLEIPRLNLNVGTNYHLLNNYIYYADSAFAQQTKTPISILQLYGKLNLKLYKFHLDNLIGVQTISEDFLPLPEFYGESSFYFKDYLFNDKMGIQIGINARILGFHNPLTYNALVGQFHLQNKGNIHNYPSLTGFAVMKRKRFQFYILMENFQELFNNASNLINQYDQRYYYEVGAYPFANNVVRWGLVWELFD